jgi:hypothetical protein
MLKEIPHLVEVELAKLPAKLTVRKLAKALAVQLVPVVFDPKYPYPRTYGWISDGTSWEPYGNAPTRVAHAFFKKRQNNDAKIIVMYNGDLLRSDVVEAVVHELAHIALDMGEETDAYQWAVEVCRRLPKKEAAPLRLGIVSILTEQGYEFDAEKWRTLVEFMLENTNDQRLPLTWEEHNHENEEEL